MDSKTELGRRLVACAIDAVVALIPAIILPPFLSGLFGAAYFLLRDALPYELTKGPAWRNRSIGKRLVNLAVLRRGGGTVDWAVSAKRNASFALAAIAAWKPAFVGPLLTLVAAGLALVEIVLVLSDSEGRRLGDRWAETKVVSREPFAARS